MPAPDGELGLLDPAGDVRIDRGIGPREHGLVVGQDAAQAADGGDIGDLVGVVDVVAIGRGDGLADDLVDADEQLGGRGGAEHFVNETVDLGVAVGVDGLGTEFLLGEALAQEAGGISVVENVAPRLELHLVVRDSERPGPERVHQPAFEIEKAQQAAAVFLHGELAAELAAVHGEAVGILGAAFGGGLPLAGEAVRGEGGLGGGATVVFRGFHNG